MRTIRTKIYKFDELSKKAQEKAIDNLRYVNVDVDWWEPTYDDAAEIGLKITGFDIGRGDFCEGEFTISANEVAANIMRDHGEMCDTYKTAADFMVRWEPAFSKYFETEEGEEDLMDMETDFLNDLLRDYLKILRDDSEYLTTDEAIKETIEANEWEFTADGKQYFAPKHSKI